MKKSNGIAWTEELERELCTPEEIAENNVAAQLICSLIDARHNKGLSQRELEALSGVRQSTIARIERGNISPTVETLARLLAPLGMTLSIRPISTSD